MHLIHRTTCRVCGSTSLTKVIDLGEQHLQGSFVKPNEQKPAVRKIPLSLARCNPTLDEKACGLLQMMHTVPPEILYSRYWYRSGTNQTMREHLKVITEDICSLISKQNALVLDIGCNDGTLLNHYPDLFEKFGIDPSDIVQEVRGGIRIIHDLFPSEELTNQVQRRKFDVITSIAMFYDLEDPINFVRNIKSHLAADGLWVFEMSYMPTMLKMNSYDTICHEHLEYYSLAVIEYILKRCGLRIFRAGLNDINGGSIRCYATHADNFCFSRHEFLDEIRQLRQEEFDFELDTDKPYKSFQDRINAHRRELTDLIKSLKQKGKRIHVYGASTKGNTILQFCGLDHRWIDYAADRNPNKHGAFTLGTNIPIISEEQSRGMNPDYYLVLPWHFRTEFLEREKKALEKGVGMIFPLPKIEIIKK
ncbi:MAG: methyltransferase [Candidatus Omnitrophica bacterium CG1_02_46_14]|nr:MAG: methyltransferase [Candidatus Omnitrophica bacterium CG1_02_46_14]